MATSQLAYAAEKAIGHHDEYTKQDVSNYEGEGLGDPNEKMWALTWQGKNDVKMGTSMPGELCTFSITDNPDQQPRSRNQRSSRTPTSSSR